MKSNLNYENVHRVMVNHLSEYIMTYNLRTAVLGISGGIDSTVVAYLLRDVEDNLKNQGYSFEYIGLSMPTETTDPNEFRISELVGNAFCQNFKVLDITHECESVVIPSVGENTLLGLKEKIRLGNVKSRLRMIHLYDFAKAYGGIVIGTDNKTELMLGFSTIGGDALFDYCPIQHLWKTEIYGLAEYYKEIEINNKNWAAVHALDESINIPPQAGLGITTNDMAEIGAPSYFEVDDVLYNDENDLPQPNEYYVVTVLERKKANAYKRNLPIVIDRKLFGNGE